MKVSKLLSSVLVAGMLTTGCSMSGDKYSVYFDSGSTKLKPEAKQAIVQAAKIAKDEDKKIKLLGHSDSAGKKMDNLKLSRERINEVNKMLMKLGVESMDVSSLAKGEGWIDRKDKSSKEDRRVEIRVY